MARTNERLLLKEAERLTVDQATEETLGGGEIATQAETDAGTDDLRIVTPKKLANYSGLGASGTYPYVLIVDSKTAGSEGGTFTQGAWRTRDLNTEVQDDDALASISSNQVTLAAGTWYIRARSAHYNVGHTILRLYNITDAAATALRSTSGWSLDSNFYDVLEGEITIASAKAFELQHRCQVTQADSGFGVNGSSSFSVAEYYSVFEAWRIAS